MTHHVSLNLTFFFYVEQRRINTFHIRSPGVTSLWDVYLLSPGIMPCPHLKYLFYVYPIENVPKIKGSHYATSAAQTSRG
ncbi:hypothetical protein ACN38_g11757 [Penicillium nordicum]|uniref:Uncharacterized protein n=1 Tax=Penicillium nordicum TaxID=229535 RepID=A0A0M9WAI1_9EURO|nr:hypothetical protein ACN38_g11757 [Penicillium nordicum]